MGKVFYQFKNSQYNVNMAIYIDYDYPMLQPRVLIIPENNSINPNVSYMN